MVVGEGFEPSKSVTADLQSAPFGRLGIPPNLNFKWCRHQESNSGPTDYKSVALPTELCRLSGAHSRRTFSMMQQKNCDICSFA